MSSVSLNQAVPDFSVASTGATELRLADLRGRKVVIYFYPKDNTPGCTLEGRDFSRLAEQFAGHDATILGVSRDNLASHRRFKEKQGFAFDLLADADAALCRLFGVLKEKTMFGRKVTGVERSTFLIDEQGVLRRAWRKVKVKGHAEEVLDAVANL